MEQQISRDVQVSSLQINSSDRHQFELLECRPIRPNGVSVIVLSEIFGLTDYIRDVCKKFAHKGFYACSPALYNRIGTRSFKYDVEQLEHKDSTKLLDVSKSLLDIKATIEHAKQHGRVAIIGYSFGATLGWLSATQERDIFYFFGYYGNRIALNLDNKPLCDYDLVFGLKDHGYTKERAELIDKSLPKENVHLYDVEHGFDCHHRPATYNGKLSESIFENIVSKLL